MFVFDGGIRLRPSGVSLDFRHRQRLGYISHAHGDHMARHQLAMCTASTSALYCHRLGRRAVRELNYHQPYVLDETTLTTVPAGHILGSSMLLVEQAGRRLLYTGDFQLAPARTAEPVGTPPVADVLVMESTFGEPKWTLPPVEDVEAEFLEQLATARSDGRVPVIFAYATGKSQEVLALLSERSDCRVLQHPKVAAITNVYRSCGCHLPEPHVYDGKNATSGDVVLLPPRNHRASFLPCPERCLKIGVTGWGLDARTRHRLEVDYVAPLSDHADFPQLLQLVDQVQPKIVFCTHGSPKFVEHLRERGVNAYVLDDTSPARL